MTPVCAQLSPTWTAGSSLHPLPPCEASLAPSTAPSCQPHGQPHTWRWGGQGGGKNPKHRWESLWSSSGPPAPHLSTNTAHPLDWPLGSYCSLVPCHLLRATHVWALGLWLHLPMPSPFSVPNLVTGPGCASESLPTSPTGGLLPGVGAEEPQEGEGGSRGALVTALWPGTGPLTRNGAK